MLAQQVEPIYELEQHSSRKFALVIDITSCHSLI
jgi:hypothetical protein